MNYLMGYSCPCPTIHVNTAAVHNSSAVSLFLLLVVVVTYVPDSSAKRKRRRLFSNGPHGRNGRPFFADLCTSCGTVKRLYVKDPQRDWVVELSRFQPGVSPAQWAQRTLCATRDCVHLGP